MNKSNNNVNGGDLVEDFRTAMIVRSTAEYAKEEADRSEQETVQGLDAISRGAYLNPTFVPEDIQDKITRASVDAHIKKVQASQIGQQSKAQLSELQLSASEKYVGKKVTITVLQKDEKPIESVWYDPKYNQYYPGVVNTKGISGKIEEVMLKKNALMIKPNLLSKLGASNRKYFVAYIINPNTLEPMVSLSM